MGKNGIAIFQICLIILAIAGGWFGFFHINSVSGHAGGGPLWITGVIVVIVVAVIVGFILNIILHECGHLIFGLLTGYKFVFFVALGMTAMKENGKTIIKKYSIAGTAGGCMLAPPDIKNGTYPYKLYVSGGFLVNFILCAIFLILFNSLAETAGLWAGAFLVIGIISAFLGLLNFVPHNVIAPDDGYILFNLGKEKNTAMRRGCWSCFKIQALLAEGTRPRDIPTELFDWVDTDSISDPFVFETVYYRYKYLLDQQKLIEAKALLQKLGSNSSNIPEMQNLTCQGELLFHELIGECRQEEIDHMYSKSLKNYIKAARSEPCVQRLMYAYSRLVLNDAAKAKECRDAFDKTCTLPIQSGIAPGEMGLIALIDAIAGMR